MTLQIRWNRLFGLLVGLGKNFSSNAKSLNYNLTSDNRLVWLAKTTSQFRGSLEFGRQPILCHPNGRPLLKIRLPIRHLDRFPIRH